MVRPQEHSWLGFPTPIVEWMANGILFEEMLTARGRLKSTSHGPPLVRPDKAYERWVLSCCLPGPCGKGQVEEVPVLGQRPTRCNLFSISFTASSDWEGPSIFLALKEVPHAPKSISNRSLSSET